MTDQRIRARQITPLQGVLLILLILVGVMLASVLGRLLSVYIPGVWTQLAVWLITGLFAFYLMREHIMELHYTVSGGMLYVERLYGIRSKVLLRVSIADIVAFGDEQALRAQRPGLGKALNATLRGCALPRKAIVYREKGIFQVALLQPDERIAALLWDEAAREASKRDKWG